MQTEQLPCLEAGEYPGGIWYYEPHTYQPYRYVLGRVGRHPLVCIGINPSTAQPGALDPTPESVERLCRRQQVRQLDHVQRLPQRATDPNDMDKTPTASSATRIPSAGSLPSSPSIEPTGGLHGAP